MKAKGWQLIETEECTCINKKLRHGSKGGEVQSNHWDLGVYLW